MMVSELFLITLAAVGLIGVAVIAIASPIIAAYYWKESEFGAAGLWTFISVVVWVGLSALVTKFVGM